MVKFVHNGNNLKPRTDSVLFKRGEKRINQSQLVKSKTNNQVNASSYRRLSCGCGLYYYFRFYFY